MPTRGFSTAGLTGLHDAMAGHVDAGRVPGMVVALSRGATTHIDAVGTAAVDGREPIGPDALFRITSMTRPVTALAALLLVDDGTLELDEPVDALLPELADRRVLRRLDGPLDDTVAAERPITLRDLLTFRGGFGMILAAPSDYPILEAEQELELRSVGPPVPVTPHGPDEWMRRMGSLPLMSQPGAQWWYNTGSQILGVLVARASGQPVESFYAERIFQPLGMDSTGFVAPEAQGHRLVPCYLAEDGGLGAFDDGGGWLHRRVFPDGGAGLVSTAGDYLAFARMLLAGGTHQGRRLVAAELVREMTSDQLTAAQRQTGGPILGGRGWGFGLSVIDGPDDERPSPRRYGWSGGFGTVWANDQEADLAAILLTQVLVTGPSPVEPDFWSATYRALDG
jgi:CubicO group peptidase (beta-lactamase class C family)